MQLKAAFHLTGQHDKNRVVTKKSSFFMMFYIDFVVCFFLPNRVDHNNYEVFSSPLSKQMPGKANNGFKIMLLQIPGA
jgi:hypothetical protein